MAIAFAKVAATRERLVYRATTDGATDTGTISNATLKSDYPDASSELGKILHVTNTTADVLKDALTATHGRVTVVPESDATAWAVEVTEGAGPNYAVQLDVAADSAGADETALIYIEALAQPSR